MDKSAIAAAFSAALLFTPGAVARDLPEASNIAFEHPVLDVATVISHFGVRTDPYRDRPSWHGGIDLGATWDAPIYAPADGVVALAGSKPGYGKTVELIVEDGWMLRFAHMSELSVNVGDTIDAGTVLGQVGSVGRGSGPHLHLETLYGDKQYDPELLKELTLYGAEKSD